MNKSKSKKNKHTSSIWGGRFIKDSSETEEVKVSKTKPKEK